MKRIQTKAIGWGLLVLMAVTLAGCSTTGSGGSASSAAPNVSGYISTTASHKL